MNLEDLQENYNINNKEYYEIVKDLLNHEKVLEMNNYFQHGTTTTLRHCINVSYYSYKLAKLFHLNYKEAARAGLLHDFFLYDWHGHELGKKHSYIHPTIAKENAIKYFNVNKKEQDIIENHMWPLTIYRLPKYNESYIVSTMDKYSSLVETITPRAKYITNLLIISISLLTK